MPFFLVQMFVENHCVYIALKFEIFLKDKNQSVHIWNLFLLNLLINRSFQLLDYVLKVMIQKFWCIRQINISERQIFALKKTQYL